MTGKRVHFVMTEDLISRIDAACPDGVSRGEFVRRAVDVELREMRWDADPRRAVERALDGGSGNETSLSAHHVVDEPPAPAEQPEWQAELRDAAEKLVGRPLPDGGEVVLPVYAARSAEQPRAVMRPSPRRHHPTCKCPVCK